MHFSNPSPNYIFVYVSGENSVQGRDFGGFSPVVSQPQAVGICAFWKLVCVWVIHLFFAIQKLLISFVFSKIHMIRSAEHFDATFWAPTFKEADKCLKPTVCFCWRAQLLVGFRFIISLHVQENVNRSMETLRWHTSRWIKSEPASPPPSPISFSESLPQNNFALFEKPCQCSLSRERLDNLLIHQRIKYVFSLNCTLHGLSFGLCGCLSARLCSLFLDYRLVSSGVSG